MPDIVISKSYHSGKCILSSASQPGTLWIERNMNIKNIGATAQITIDAEGVSEIIELIKADGLEVEDQTL